MPNLAPFLISGLAVGAIYALSGVGLVVLYRTCGVLNFAYGAIGAVGALVAWQLVQLSMPVLLASLAAIVVTTALSLLYGWVIAPRLAYRETVVRGVATLGFALLLLGMCDLLWRSNTPRQVRLPTDTLGFTLLGARVTGTRLTAFLLALAITVGVVVFLNRARLGVAMRALANDRDVSALLGISVLRVELWAWLISGIMAGVSGLLLASLVNLNAGTLTFLVIPAMATAILGRLRSLGATLAGGLCIGLAEALATPFAAIAPYRSVAPFAIALLAILWQQQQPAFRLAKD